MTMDFFSITDKKPKDLVYVMLNSIKSSKEQTTTLNYYLLVDELDDQFQQYFKDLEDDYFHLFFINASIYKDRIKLNQRSYLYFLRCLAPSIFPLLDKVLYLDTDVFAVNSGIEELWNTDISTKYAAGAIDIEIEYNNPYQMVNVHKGQGYYNAGVLLMNLKRMRQNDVDKKLEQYLTQWPKQLRCILYDQTLRNYVTKGQDKIISTKWNSSILAMLQRDKNAYQNFYCTQDLTTYIQKAVLIHLKGPKPWQPLSPFTQAQIVFRKEAQSIFGQIYKQFAKHEEF